MTAANGPDASSDSRAGRGRALVLVAAFLGWMFDGLEMGIFPLVARPALQQMQTDSGVTPDAFVGHWMGVITALFLIGAAFGGLAFGWLGDRVGRVRAMSLSILCYSAFTGITYFAQTPWQLGGLRFLAALGMGGEWALGVALVMEVWPERHRPVLAGVIGAAANIGFVLIGLVAFRFHITRDNWRFVLLFGALPAVLTFFVRLFVPESERWKKAVAGPARQPLREVLSARHLRSTLLATAFCGIALIGTWGSVQWLPLWADQMTGGTLPAAKAHTAMVSGLGAVVGCLLGGFLGGRVSRRRAYFLLCLGSLLVCAALFRGVTVVGPAFFVLTFLAGGFTAAFYGWFPLYLPELFPTRIRATGQGLAYNAGRVLAAIGALQMGALMQQFDGSYARAGAVITLVYAVGLVLVWFAPETHGRPLPE
jgi:MFS transporter, SHS family, sialic acid transporter